MLKNNKRLLTISSAFLVLGIVFSSLVLALPTSFVLLDFYGAGHLITVKFGPGYCTVNDGITPPLTYQATATEDTYRCYTPIPFSVENWGGEVWWWFRDTRPETWGIALPGPG